MLRSNVAMMEHQDDVAKLRAMIEDEEIKLAKAKDAFKEDSARFQTFLFETKQVNDKIEEQYKDVNKQKKKLEEEESKL